MNREFYLNYLGVFEVSAQNRTFPVSYPNKKPVLLQKAIDTYKAIYVPLIVFGTIYVLVFTNSFLRNMIQIIKKTEQYLYNLLFCYMRTDYYVLAFGKKVMHNADIQHSRSISSHENTSFMHNLPQICVSFLKYPNFTKQIGPLDYHNFKINQNYIYK